MNAWDEAEGEPMDLKCFSTAADYIPPHCYELCGQQFDLSLTGKNAAHYNLTVSFSEFPSRELIAAGEMLDSGTYTYDCIKAYDGAYQISFRYLNTCIFIVLETDNTLAYLIAATAADEVSYETFTGTFDGNAVPEAIKPTEILVGNTVNWTFGENKVARVKFSKNKSIVTADFNYNMYQISDAPCIVYPVNDEVFFQCLCLNSDRSQWLLMALSNFNNMIGTGVMFGIVKGEVTYKVFGSYGKFISYSEEKA